MTRRVNRCFNTTSLCFLLVLSLAACSSRAPQAEPAAGEASESEGMTVEELLAMPKVDAHAHIVSLKGANEAEFFALLERHNLKWITIATRGTQWDRVTEIIDSAVRLTPEYPHNLAWITTFNLENWGEPDWKDRALATIEEGFERGAVGVKVWKEIGMVLQDPDGGFVMIDDPRFEPVFRLIEAHGKTLLAHIGEPRNCWLPLDSMTVNNDRNYFRENPQYHAYRHPEIPHYWKHIAARDSVLARHPKLRLVGAHLGSLEWDVDSLARRLDLYPNFAVDMSARICHFQVQDREKVRSFFLKYQDRLMYATDYIASGGQGSGLSETLERMEKTYMTDYRYFATGEEMSAPEVNGPFRGLALPRDVLQKVFRENARNWYPGIGSVGVNSAYAAN
ncbi:MAG: amidohydrolase family protein [Candidatus Glassbacteria bacterium]|nr:amidohydrolase family protein [Candidatus Glassbacteria bacterium]